MRWQSEFAAVRRVAIAAALAIFLHCGGFCIVQAGQQFQVQVKAQPGLQMPAGTVLPVRLNHQISTNRAREGQEVTARLMQDVPLPGGGKICEGARIRGTIVGVSTAGARGRSTLTVRFDHLESHGQRMTFITDLRALASFLEVVAAQTPETSPGFGTPYVWATTRLIGGGEKYGAGGPVTDEWSNTVGKGTFSGVLVHLRARPGSPCRGELGDGERFQALWVFSADACGVYGMEGVSIQHAGRTEPLGQIVIASVRGELKLRSGSGLLLRVTEQVP